MVCSLSVITNNYTIIIYNYVQCHVIIYTPIDVYAFSVYQGIHALHNII